MRSYRTFSPLPPPVARQFGGVFSVALSLRSPSLAVSQHTALGVRTFLPGRDEGRGDHPTHSCGTLSVPRDPRLWNRDVGVRSCQDSSTGRGLATGDRHLWATPATYPAAEPADCRAPRARCPRVPAAPTAAFGRVRRRKRRLARDLRMASILLGKGAPTPRRPRLGRPDPLSTLEEVS